MKILLLGDVHIGVRGDAELFRNYQVRFFKEILFPHILKNNITTVIQMGDIFDRRKYTNHLTLAIMKIEFFDWFRDNNIDLRILIGNHDCFYTNTNSLNTPYLFLGEYENITYYEEPQDVVIEGNSFLFLPWVNKENREKTIELLKTSKSKIALGHLEINGFEMYEGSIGCSNGFEPELFKRFDATLSGHFHQPSEYSNIKYLGAIGQFTWSDYGCDRGFFVYDTNMGAEELEFIVNPFNPFEKIYYEESIDIINFDYDSLVDKIVKIVVTEKEDLDKYDLFVDLIRKCGVASYKIIDNSVYHYFEQEIDESVLTEDTLEFVNSYIQSINVSDKDEVTTMFRELYLEAINTNIID